MPALTIWQEFLQQEAASGQGRRRDVLLLLLAWLVMDGLLALPSALDSSMTQSGPCFLTAGLSCASLAVLLRAVAAAIVGAVAFLGRSNCCRSGGGREAPVTECGNMNGLLQGHLVFLGFIMFTFMLGVAAPHFLTAVAATSQGLPVEPFAATWAAPGGGRMALALIFIVFVCATAVPWRGALLGFVAVLLALYSAGLVVSHSLAGVALPVFSGAAGIWRPVLGGGAAIVFCAVAAGQYERDAWGNFVQRKRLQLQAVRSEELLALAMPRSVAHNLMRGQSLISTHRSVTVAFLYIRGFDDMVRQAEGEGLLALLEDLHQLWCRLDALVLSSPHIHKIESVANVYLVASGVPAPHRDHAAAVVEFCLAALELCRDMQLEREVREAEEAACRAELQGKWAEGMSPAAFEGDSDTAGSGGEGGPPPGASPASVRAAVGEAWWAAERARLLESMSRDGDMAWLGDLSEAITAGAEAGSASWEFKAGVTSGSVTGGVIGLSRTYYRLFGDVVNTSSRLGVTGPVGRVHISRATYMALDAPPCVNDALPPSQLAAARAAVAQGGGSQPSSGKGGLVVSAVAPVDMNRQDAADRRNASVPWYFRAGHNFRVTCRGIIRAKGKGLMLTYLVDRPTSDHLLAASELAARTARRARQAAQQAWRHRARVLIVQEVLGPELAGVLVHNVRLEAGLRTGDGVAEAEAARALSVAGEVDEDEDDEEEEEEAGGRRPPSEGGGKFARRRLRHIPSASSVLSVGSTMSVSGSKALPAASLPGEASLRSSAAGDALAMLQSFNSELLDAAASGSGKTGVGSWLMSPRLPGGGGGGGSSPTNRRGSAPTALSPSKAQGAGADKAGSSDSRRSSVGAPPSKGSRRHTRSGSTGGYQGLRLDASSAGPGGVVTAGPTTPTPTGALSTDLAAAAAAATALVRTASQTSVGGAGGSEAGEAGVSGPHHSRTPSGGKRPNRRMSGRLMVRGRLSQAELEATGDAIPELHEEGDERDERDDTLRTAAPPPKGERQASMSSSVFTFDSGHVEGGAPALSEASPPASLTAASEPRKPAPRPKPRPQAPEGSSSAGGVFADFHAVVAAGDPDPESEPPAPPLANREVAVSRWKLAISRTQLAGAMGTDVSSLMATAGSGGAAHQYASPFRAVPSRTAAAAAPRRDVGRTLALLTAAAAAEARNQSALKAAVQNAAKAAMRAGGSRHVPSRQALATSKPAVPRARTSRRLPSRAMSSSKARIDAAMPGGDSVHPLRTDSVSSVASLHVSKAPDSFAAFMAGTASAVSPVVDADAASADAAEMGAAAPMAVAPVIAEEVLGDEGGVGGQGTQGGTTSGLRDADRLQGAQAPGGLDPLALDVQAEDAETMERFVFAQILSSIANTLLMVSHEDALVAYRYLSDPITARCKVHFIRQMEALYLERFLVSGGHRGGEEEGEVRFVEVPAAPSDEDEEEEEVVQVVPRQHGGSPVVVKDEPPSPMQSEGGERTSPHQSEGSDSPGPFASSGSEEEDSGEDSGEDSDTSSSSSDDSLEATAQATPTMDALVDTVLAGRARHRHTRRASLRKPALAALATSRRGLAGRRRSRHSMQPLFRAASATKSRRGSEAALRRRASGTGQRSQSFGPASPRKSKTPALLQAALAVRKQEEQAAEAGARDGEPGSVARRGSQGGPAGDSPRQTTASEDSKHVPPSTPRGELDMDALLGLPSPDAPARPRPSSGMSRAVLRVFDMAFDSPHMERSLRAGEHQERIKAWAGILAPLILTTMLWLLLAVPAVADVNSALRRASGADFTTGGMLAVAVLALAAAGMVAFVLSTIARFGVLSPSREGGAGARPPPHMLQGGSGQTITQTPSSTPVAVPPASPMLRRASSSAVFNAPPSSAGSWLQAAEEEERASAPLARGGSGGDLLPPPASPSEGQGGGEQDALLSTGQVTAAGRHLRLMDTDILIPHPACTSLRLSCAHCCSRNCAALHRQALWLDSSLSARSLVLLFLSCAVLLLADALAVRVHYPTASPDALLFHAGLLPCMLMVLSHIFRLRTGVQVTAAAGVLLEFLIITAATGVLGAAAPASILLVLLQLLGLAALALYNTFYTELNARRAMLLVMASHRAKRQADSVMGQLLPASVNDALNRNESIPFRMLPFDAVILWADLVGFTALSASMDSMAVLRLLHTIFAQCDALVEASGLWKLDTIGDAYVCVGFGEAAGQGPALVEKQFALALAMQDIVEKAGGGCGLGVRVGIHAGPVATGIIGTLRPRFYVFGRTVLEAEHMEASGATGRVQVSPAAASLYFQRTYGLQQREGAPAALFGEGPSPATFWLSPQGVLEPGDARQPRVEQE